MTFQQNLAQVKQAVDEANKQFCFDYCPMFGEFDSSFFQFMSDNKLSMNYLREDTNGLPVYIIIGTSEALEKFVDTVYDCGIQEENDEMKKWIKEYQPLPE